VTRAAAIADVDDLVADEVHSGWKIFVLTLRLPATDSLVISQVMLSFGTVAAVACALLIVGLNVYLLVVQSHKRRWCRDSVSVPPPRRPVGLEQVVVEHDRIGAAPTPANGPTAPHEITLTYRLPGSASGLRL
jgi:hypothetical protein